MVQSYDCCTQTCSDSLIYFQKMTFTDTNVNYLLLFINDHTKSGPLYNYSGGQIRIANLDLRFINSIAGVYIVFLSPTFGADTTS